MKFVSVLALFVSALPLLAQAEPAVVQNGQFKPSAFLDRLRDQKLPDGCSFTKLELREADGQNSESATIGIHQIARTVSLDIGAPVPVKVFADGTFRAEWVEELGSAKTSLTVQFNKDLSIRSLNYSQSVEGDSVPEQINCKPLFN